MSPFHVYETDQCANVVNIVCLKVVKHLIKTEYLTIDESCSDYVYEHTRMFPCYVYES